MSVVKFKKQRFPWMNSALERSINLDDFFENDFFSRKSSLPPMNVKEHEDDFEIEFSAPGFTKEDFVVEIEDDILTVSAEKSQENLTEEDNYTRKEFNYQNFQKTLQLPKSVDASQDIKANYKNGILKIKLLKTKASVKSIPKQIKVS
ncbi:Hsp20/alpha crystallin family protein [Christiangramia salexigens]|uniref:Heat-shock protein n=1 Tax=Christiangramia salexigens TaxID=1913577 RepID=A0A1L3J1X8_9FLAO|nr:Hsp20/alpha crystallin family protein [Christiangramia salexigens]APG59123.1 heat-shock protein [Christiangramia salexigens]